MRVGHNLRSRLEVATNVAVLLVGAAVLFTFGWNFNRSRHPTTRLRPGLQKGSTLCTPAGLNYGDASETLLVAISTHCEHCAGSVPFYNQLAEPQGSAGRALRVVAVFPEGEDEVRDYAARTQLRLDAVAAADFSALNLSMTPTLILVDRGGNVLDFWDGQLSADAEQQVLRRVDR